MFSWKNCGWTSKKKFFFRVWAIFLKCETFTRQETALSERQRMALKQSVDAVETVRQDRVVMCGVRLAVFNKPLSFDNGNKFPLCSFIRGFSVKVSPFLENISSAQTLSLHHFLWGHQRKWYKYSLTKSSVFPYPTKVFSKADGVKISGGLDLSIEIAHFDLQSVTSIENSFFIFSGHL